MILFKASKNYLVLVLTFLIFVLFVFASEAATTTGSNEQSAQPIKQYASEQGNSGEELQSKVINLESRVNDLESRVWNAENRYNNIKSGASVGLVSFLFGAFCALWAQNTRRNALGWFVAGTILNVIAVLVLLWHNYNDQNHPPNNTSIFK